MITHCPSCQTGFRVRPEQLAVRAGLVRCGKCSRVFDAREYLLEEDAPDIGAQLQDAAAGQRVQAPGEMMSGAAETLDFELEAGKPTDVYRPVAESAAAADATAFDFGPAAEASPVGRTRRWPWILGASVLILLLLGQAAYQYRTAIILLFPEAKPYAARLCADLGCDLPLPRRAELVSIEASDLQADTNNPNVMVLSATLKNRAVFEQQLPLLELTLTDAQDQPVVRRVLAPHDYLGKASAARAGFAANTEIPIKVFVEGSQVKATGYRLYLFYP